MQNQSQPNAVSVCCVLATNKRMRERKIRMQEMHVDEFHTKLKLISSTNSRSTEY